MRKEKSFITLTLTPGVNVRNFFLSTERGQITLKCLFSKTSLGFAATAGAYSDGAPYTGPLNEYAPCLTHKY